MVPESDVQEEASDIIQDSSMAKNSEKGKCLDLFDNSVQDSPHDVNTSSIKTESKPQTNYLQVGRVTFLYALFNCFDFLISVLICSYVFC